MGLNTKGIIIYSLKEDTRIEIICQKNKNNSADLQLFLVRASKAQRFFVLREKNGILFSAWNPTRLRDNYLHNFTY